MKIIPASYEILKPDDPYKHIELCGRVCYKSEDKITDESAVKFIQGVIKSGHESVLEHLRILLIFCADHDLTNTAKKYSSASVTYNHVGDYHMISANIRSLRNMWNENVLPRYAKAPLLERYPELFNGVDKLERKAYDAYAHEAYGFKYENIRDKLHHYPLSIRFIVDRGISHELVRHRVFSFSQESTRFCNYLLGKFGSELTFIKPFFWGEFSPEYKVWKTSCETAEMAYNTLINRGCKPQEARSVLPNSLKTELIMTGTLAQWVEFFKLRALGLSGKPHPQMLEVTVPLLKDCAELHPDTFGSLLEGLNVN